MYLIKKLNLSSFNTNNVTNMRDMFKECSSLKELDLYNFNIINVKYIYVMFYGCPDELKKIKMLKKEYK